MDPADRKGVIEPTLRQEAHGKLAGMFQELGHQAQGGTDAGLGGMVGQLEELMTMPMDLAMIFVNMSTQLAEMVLKSLEEAGFTLVKGLTPL